MQEALLKTYRYAARIREPEAFRAWLYRTVRNACLIGRRKRAHEPDHIVSLDEAPATATGTSVRWTRSNRDAAPRSRRSTPACGRG